MTLDRAEGWAHVLSWTQTDSLRKHARAVEVVMRRAAEVYGARDVAADALPALVERWGLAGMLHDADYERWPDEHPKRIVAWLEARGDHDLAHAISAHYTQWNVPYETTLDRALLACDELTGFVVACCLVRPDGIHSLEVKSVKKRLKEKAFAAKVDRAEVYAGAEKLGVHLDAHIAMIIEALRPHAEELGIQGRGAAKG